MASSTPSRTRTRVRSHSRPRRLLRSLAGAFSLRRWENYCLLAIASLAFLAVVAIRSEAGTTLRKATRVFPTARTALLTPSQVASLPAKPRDTESAWRKRHALIKSKVRDTVKAQASLDVLLLGDSITQGWEFRSQWQALYPQVSAVNAGIASDRVEHIQWRVQDGLLGTSRPKVIVLLAGINNLALHDAERIAATQAATIRALRLRSPKSKILLMGVFPSGQQATHPRRAKIARLNDHLAQLADGDAVHFLDVGKHFVAADGSLSPTVMFDYLHLTARGYRIWAAAMAPKLRDLLARDPQA